MSRRPAISNDPSRLIACQEALASFGRYALSTDDLDALLKTACEEVARGLDVPIAKIAVVTPDGRAMLLKAAAGLPATAGVPGVTTVPAGARSAMGYTLLMGGPVVSTVDTETRFEPSEVVRKSGVHSSVNVVLWTGDEAFGVLEADSREPDVFGEHDVHFLQLYANLVGAAVERQRLWSRAESLSRERELLLNESVHRIKNILAIVQAIAWRLAKEAASLSEFNNAFGGRISALGRLQDAMLQEGDLSISLAELVRREIGVTGAREGADFVLEGPDVLCDPPTARALGLLFYELTTNASKHGALSPDAAPGAQLDVSWQSEPSGQLQIHWKEHASAPKTSHKSGGFGSKLVSEVIPKMLGGTAQLSIGEEGAECIVRFPIQASGKCV